jgi:hypothetical protein
VGGSIGEAGQKLKEGAGKLSRLAAVPVSLFNPALGGALAAGGRILDTSQGGAGLGDIAGSALGTYGVGRAAGPLVRAIPGVGSAGDWLGAHVPGADRITRAVGSVAGAGAPGGAPSGAPGAPAAAAPGGGGGFLDWLKEHALEVGMGGLAAGQAVMGAQQSRRAGDLQDRALGVADETWGAGAPLREQGRLRLLNPAPVDLSSTFADPTNPFARRRALPAALPAVA